MKIKTILIAVIAILLVVGGVGIWYYEVQRPREEAKAEAVVAANAAYEDAVDEFKKMENAITEKNNALDKVIKDAKAVLNSKEKPFDDGHVKPLEDAIANAEKTRRTPPKMEAKTKDIIQQTTDMKNNSFDYKAEIKLMKDTTKNLNNSIIQRKQITNPSQDYVLTRLKNVATIKESAPVTPENDPNGNLNKEGGYTATIYFSDMAVTTEVLGDDVIAKGTVAGGSIEVYPSVEDANKRNDDLTAIDTAEPIKTGSHTVVGTMVVRTSNLLTEEQQKDLETRIIWELTKLEE